MKIIIDSGHGGSEPGAVAFGTKEKDLNLIYAKLLADKLENHNINVDRSIINDIYYTPSNLTNIIKKSGASICISCHNNAFNGTAQGFEVIHSIHSDGRLAKEILDEVHKTGHKTRRFFSRESTSLPGQDYYYIIRLTYPDVETIIVEFGFMDNRDDFQMLTDPVWQNKLTDAVVKGVRAYIFPDKQPEDEHEAPAVPSHWAKACSDELMEAGLLYNDHSNVLNEPPTKGEVFCLVNRLRKELIKND